MFKKRSKLLLITLCLLLVVTGTSPVSAEGTTPFKVSNLNISVMPEYDNSQVLILYGIDFVNTSQDPYNGEIRFPVPEGTSNNIVKESGNGKHLQVRIDTANGYPEFVWQPSQPIAPNSTYPIHLEYYYNPLPATGFKEFVYQFKPAWSVDKSQVYILQPLKAEGIKMEPAATLLGKDDKGFNIYQLNYPALKAGDPIELKVSYNKNDPNPSVDPPSAQTAQFTTQPTEAAGSIDPMGIAAIVMLSVLAVIMIAMVLKKEFTGSKDKKPREPGRKTSLDKNDQLEEEKRRLRQKLLSGEISEDTYHLLLLEIENDYR